MEKVDGNLWDLPIQQAEQKSSTILFDKGTLHCLSTSFKRLELGWPNLMCHDDWELHIDLEIKLDLAYSESMVFLQWVLLDGFAQGVELELVWTMEFTATVEGEKVIGCWRRSCMLL